MTQEEAEHGIEITKDINFFGNIFWEGSRVKIINERLIELERKTGFLTNG